MKRIKSYALLVIVMMIGYTSYSQTDSVPPYCIKPHGLDSYQNPDSTHKDHNNKCYITQVYVKDVKNFVHTVITIECDEIIGITFESTENRVTVNNYNKYISWKIWKQNYQLRK